MYPTPVGHYDFYKGEKSRNIEYLNVVGIFVNFCRYEWHVCSTNRGNDLGEKEVDDKGVA